jgi:cephalosporin hydroxylase
MAEFMGRKMMQEYQDVAIWDKFFDKYKVKTLIELGTGYGGLSLYFGLKCHERGIEFYTFDNIQSTDFQMPKEIEIGLAKSFHLINIFSDEGIALIRKIITESTKPTAIFFDDGDKAREWRTFAPSTSVGDFLAVHDWDVEFKSEDVVAVDVQRIFVEECEARKPGFLSMWFERI